MIDFERDQQDAMKKTDNIQSLADQVENLEEVSSEIEDAEKKIKGFKKKTRPFIGGSHSDHDVGNVTGIDAKPRESLVLLPQKRCRHCTCAVRPPRRYSSRGAQAASSCPSAACAG